MSQIQIYVACLAAYNAGHLHGEWIDATQDIDEIQAQINTMLKNSPVEDAEEYAIHDTDGFEGCPISEYQNIQSVQQIALFIEQNEPVAALLLNHFCGDLEDSIKALKDYYHGSHKSLADYAQELTEDSTQIPKHLAPYIDYERMGRDMELSGSYYTIEEKWDEIHIFTNH